MNFYKQLSFSTKVLIGLFFGAFIGVFFGEKAQFLSVVGDVFIGLLQMTVLPYIMFSLIVNIGRLSLREGKRLILKGIASLGLLLVVGLIGLILLPLSLPEWGGGSFYSEDFTLAPVEFDFVKNYIPANLFASLSTNIVPAVVIFSIFLGLGLMNIEKKEVFLAPLDVLNKALNEVNKLVIKLTPMGVLAIAAGIVSSLSLTDLSRLQGYLLVYLLAVGLFLFLILPVVIHVFTPYSAIKVLKILRPTLITIFATGKIIVVFPQLIENIKQVLAEHNTDDEESKSAVDVIMPLVYPFPNLGTFMIFIFVPFAAWYTGEKLLVGDYPLFLSSTLLSSFVAPITGLPFSLDLMGIPKDTFQLFVVSTVLTDRVRVVLGAFHLVVLSLLTVTGLRNDIQIKIKALLIGVVSILVIGICSIMGLNKLLEKSMASIPTNKEIMNHLKLISKEQPFEVLETSVQNPFKKRRKENSLARIKRSGVLRVGFYNNSIPFSFWNEENQLVGYSVDLAHKLAQDLEVAIEFVPIATNGLVDGITKDHYDIVLSDIFLTHSLAKEVMVSESFMEVSLVLLVEREDRRAYNYSRAIELDTFNIGYFERKDVSNEFQAYFPQASMHEIANYDVYFNQEVDSVHLDGLITSAEKAYSYTLFHPNYRVVDPFPNKIKFEIISPLAKDEVWRDYINSWIKYRKNDGTFDARYRQWILGKPFEEEVKNWSIYSDILGLD
jgi:proton glutamate symport protein